MATITRIVQDWQPAPLNALMNRHWSGRNRMKSRDKRVIAALFAGAEKTTVKRRVTLTIILGHRKRGCDPDAYWKSLLDGLVKCGMLVDDSAAWCELMPVIYVRDPNGRSGCEITLEDVGGV